MATWRREPPAPDLRVGHWRDTMTNALQIRSRHQCRIALTRELRVCLDLANLQDVALFVRGDEQRPLIGVAILPLHQAAAQIVLRRPYILQQLGVLGAMGFIPPWRSGSFRDGSSVCSAISRFVRSMPSTARQRRSSRRLARHSPAWRCAGSSSRSDRPRPGGRGLRGSTTRWAKA